MVVWDSQFSLPAFLDKRILQSFKHTSVGIHFWKKKITLLSAEKEENVDVLIFKFYSTISPRHTNIVEEKVY